MTLWIKKKAESFNVYTMGVGVPQVLAEQRVTLFVRLKSGDTGQSSHKNYGRNPSFFEYSVSSRTCRRPRVVGQSA